MQSATQSKSEVAESIAGQTGGEPSARRVWISVLVVPMSPGSSERTKIVNPYNRDKHPHLIEIPIMGITGHISGIG
jgi:hypothetical protein